MDFKDALAESSKGKGKAFQECWLLKLKRTDPELYSQVYAALFMQGEYGWKYSHAVMAAALKKSGVQAGTNSVQRHRTEECVACKKAAEA